MGSEGYYAFVAGWDERMSWLSINRTEWHHHDIHTIAAGLYDLSPIAIAYNPFPRFRLFRWLPA